MAKKKKQKPWYFQWWAILLIIIVAFYFFQLLNNQFFKSEDEKSRDYITNYLEKRDYENIIAGYYGEVASVETEHWKKPPSRHASTILHPLYSSWKNATYYSIKIETKGEMCSYFIDGNDYRSWRVDGDNDAFTRWQNDITESEDCY
jgi:preprotein translocase subunit YajC